MIENTAIKRLRDHAAHPERFHRTTPIESSRTIADVAEFINRMWGERTPGGHLYPAPLERVPLVMARTVDGVTVTCLTPDDLLHSDTHAGWSGLQPFSEEGAWEFSLVLCPKGLDVLSYALHGLESAPYPIDLLWGPGTRHAALAAWSANAVGWAGDRIETIDRPFLVRYQSGNSDPDWPVDISRARAPQPPEGLGEYLLVVADVPHDAYAHARAARQPGHVTSGHCDDCRVTAHGAFPSISDALAAARLLGL